MGVGTIFGLAVGLLFVLSMVSRHRVSQKLALLLIASWSLSNFAVKALGFGSAPIVLPSLDAFFAIAVALLYLKTRELSAMLVMGFFFIAGLVHVSAFALNAQGEYGYYAILNLVFLLQILCVGGPCVAQLGRTYGAYRRDPRTSFASLLHLRLH